MSASDHTGIVVVANRLPVDVRISEEGEVTWTRSPGGLVAAMAPVMRDKGTWVGWPGGVDAELEPFDDGGIHMIPVALSEAEVTGYYEGFSNSTLWPLYHDVIVAPEYHREWWYTYRRVNERFAAATAEAAEQGATVWVQDYQLQLVPKLLREARPDLRIGYFGHIPFPPVELFGQLPWRRQVVEGLLGADLIGFQRSGDAHNFLRAVRSFSPYPTRGRQVPLGEHWNSSGRSASVEAFPISIDATGFDELSRTPEVLERAAQIRADLGDPEVILLGVDRLDYTKGIRHRIKAYGELVQDHSLRPGQATLVQVASPSREGVEGYVELRRHVEEMVGRLNGEYGQLGTPIIHYLHHAYPVAEMAALYRAADVMLVTALRDGMNLVAKEYVAARSDLGGALVLSEFAGAADELTQAMLINPHDIEGMKSTIMRAIQEPTVQARRRMRSLRRRVLSHDVEHWATSFLAALEFGS